MSTEDHAVRELLEGVVGLVKGVTLSSVICLVVWLVIVGQPIQTTFQ